MRAAETEASDLTFSPVDLIKLVAATYLPLCDELEAQGALDRAKLADAMDLYLDPLDTSASTALVAALQTVLRRPRPDAPPAQSSGQSPVTLRLIPGGQPNP